MNQASIRQTLTRRQQQLQQRLEAVEHDLQKSHSADWSEQAQERENDEVLEAIANETAIELAQLKRVLKKMTGHNYGICSECGQPINEKRLAAIPSTEYCIDCANRH